MTGNNFPTFKVVNFNIPSNFSMLTIKKNALLLIILVFIILGFKPLSDTISSYQAARTLAEHIHQEATVIPCGRSPITASDARQNLEANLPNLQSSLLQAATNCALGERSAAYNLYSRMAETGDTWAALQVFFLSHGQEIPTNLAGQLSSRELPTIYQLSLQTDPAIEWLPLIRQLTDYMPFENAVWQLWLAEGRRLEQKKQWTDALAWYQEGLDKQTVLMVKIYRSSLAFRAGVIAQTALTPRDLHKAMTYYDEALQAQAFSKASDRLNLYNFRGQALYNLRGESSLSAAIKEFQQTLTLDGRNFTATLWTGIVYLNGYNDAPQALIWFRNAAILKETDQNVHYYLGLTYTKLGQKVEAARAFDRALEINPGWAEVRKLREALP